MLDNMLNRSMTEGNGDMYMFCIDKYKQKYYCVLDYKEDNYD